MPQKTNIERANDANTLLIEHSAIEAITRAVLNVVKGAMFACFGVAALIAANAL